jgi:hypothetical protein
MGVFLSGAKESGVEESSDISLRGSFSEIPRLRIHLLSQRNATLGMTAFYLANSNL